MLSDIEVSSLNLLLSILYRAGNQLMLDRFILTHAHLIHDIGNVLAAEQAQEIILKRKIEA